MKLTIDELLKGKATIIKGKEYFSTEAYVTPFLEKMSKFTNRFEVHAKLPDQMSLTKNQDFNLEDTVFNRVWIQAILPEEYGFEDHLGVIGLVYGLDTRKPVSKIYRGAINTDNSGLCMFSPAFLNVQEIEPESPISLRCIQPLMEQTSDIKAQIDRLSNIEIPYNDRSINENLGLWIRRALNLSYDTGYGKVKLATSVAIDAYKLLYEKSDSPYLIQPGQSTTAFNIYSAFTDLITNVDTRDIMNKAEKTLLLKDILGL